MWYQPIKVWWQHCGLKTFLVVNGKLAWTEWNQQLKKWYQVFLKARLWALFFCWSMICRNPSVLKYSHLFADDCLIYHTIQNQSDHQVLQDDLKQLENWQQQWLMQCNPSKFSIIRMTSPRRKPKILDIMLCGQILNPVDSYPYLGVELTRTMSWNLHIDNTVKKANSVMGLIKRNLYDAPKNTKTLAYQSIVRPNLEYSATIWDPKHKRALTEKVQRSAARFACVDYSRHSSVTSYRCSSLLNGHLYKIVGKSQDSPTFLRSE